MVLVLIKEKELGKITAVTQGQSKTFKIKYLMFIILKSGDCFLKTQNYANLKKIRIWFDW